MATTANPQTAIDERNLDNDELEAALERHERLKTQAGKARKAKKEAHEEVKGMIAEFHLQDGEVARCGRFRIEKRHVPARSVSFDTSPSSRLRITPVPTEPAE